MKALTQLGSEIVVDGKRLATRDLNVEALYAEPSTAK